MRIRYDNQSFIPRSVSNWTTSDAASRRPHDVTTERLARWFFVFTSHDGLSVVAVVSGQHFLSSDITDIVTDGYDDWSRSTMWSVLSLGHDMARI